MNLLGIDFEDWFHPELIQKNLKTKNKNPTVINGIDKILDWLRRNETFATFFMVGELLEYRPELLDKIISNGHEIGFHTMHHTRLDSPGFENKLQDELKTFDKLTNGKSKGFRAPTFSLNYNSSWAIDLLAQNGYVYDSSIVPAKSKLYGVPTADVKPYKISSKSLEKNDPDGKIFEYPLLVTKLLGKKIPAGGGFYLRLLPLQIIENAIKNYNQNDMPATFYIHSWELTPEFMPKVPLSILNNFITYHNLKGALGKMTNLIKKFEFTSFSRYMK